MEKKYTIVVAEDDDLMRGAIVSAFEADSVINVLQVNNGRDALVFALEKHPDLVMLDVAMPVLDGISTLRKIREDAWGKQAKVILLTSLGGSDMVMKEVEKLNPAHCFVKDQVAIEDVVQKARALIGLAG